MTRPCQDHSFSSTGGRWEEKAWIVLWRRECSPRRELAWELCVYAPQSPSMVQRLTGTRASMQMGAVPKTMRQTRTQWLLSPSSLRDMQTSSANTDCPIDSADCRERPVGLHQDTFFTPDVLIKAYWPKWDPSYSGNIGGESAQAVLHGHTQKRQVSISNWQIPPPLPVAVWQTKVFLISCVA